MANEFVVRKGLKTLDAGGGLFSDKIAVLDSNGKLKSGSFSYNDLTGSLTLSTVTDNGNTTTNNITIGELTASNARFNGDIVVTGNVTAQEFHTEFVSASIIYQSGSTKFGDTSDDVHSFTGSIQTVGDLNVNNRFILDNANATITAGYLTRFSEDVSITGSFVVSGSAGDKVDFTGVDAISGSIFSGSFVGDGSGLTGITGFSVTNQTNNRIITSTTSGSGNAETNLTFDGSTLQITGSAIIGNAQSSSLQIRTGYYQTSTEVTLSTSGTSTHDLVFLGNRAGWVDYYIADTTAGTSRSGTLIVNQYNGTAVFTDVSVDQGSEVPLTWQAIYAGGNLGVRATATSTNTVTVIFLTRSV